MAGPEDISSTDKIDPTKSIQPGEQEQPKPSQSFQSMMEGKEPQGAGVKPEGPSPFDLAAQGKAGATTGPTTETILGQMNSTSSLMGDLQNQLSKKNLNLRQSQKYLLRNKLSSANKNIRSAAGKLGVDVGPPVAKFSRQSPINKFLGYLTDSMQQMGAAQEKIKQLNISGQSINPGDLLMIQVKLAKSQQEMEYSSVLLSTATSDIKTLFNIQL